MCASEAQVLGNMTVQTLQGMRKDEMFKLFFSMFISYVELKNLCYLGKEEHQFVLKLVRELVTLAQILMNIFAGSTLKFWI